MLGQMANYGEVSTLLYPPYPSTEPTNVALTTLIVSTIRDVVVRLIVYVSFLVKCRWAFLLRLLQQMLQFVSRTA